MRPSPPLISLSAAATLAVTSSAFDFGGGNDVLQTAGTVAPDQATDSLTPTSGGNGFGNFGIPTQFTNPSTGGDQGQTGWPSSPGGNQDWGTQGVDCSGSNEGGWSHQGWQPPSGGQGWWSGGQGWTAPGGDQGTLGVDCSGSTEGGWTPPSGDKGWGTLGVDCSGSNEGGWTPPSGGEGSGTLGVDCSGSAGGVTPDTGSGVVGSSAVEGSQEAASAASSDNTAPAVSTTGSSTTETSGTSSSTGEQGSQPSSVDASSNTETEPTSTGGSSTTETGGSTTTESSGSSTTESGGSTETSGVSSGAEYQGSSQVAQTSTTETSATPTGSNVGADADQTSMLRSSTTSTSQQEQFQGQEQLQQGEKTPGGDVVQSMSVWGAPVVANTGTNLTSAEPTFGKITSKAGGCVIAEPTEYISESYLDWVWEHRIGPNVDTSDKANWNVMANKNFLMDKFVHNKGSINYCVRWDTDNQLSKDVASKFKGVLERHYNKWNKWLEGYNCWPFKQLKVNMVGWAAKDKSQFEWTDNSLGPFYEGTADSDGVPQCPDECYRFYDNVNNQWSDTSACAGEPFDVSFWLKEDIPYGFGYDWGQEVSLNDTMKNLYNENILFIGHEIGHGFGLPDFYGLETKPSKDFPNSIMMAYSSSTITPSDGWMLRRILDHVRDRYNF